ncbi:hypothetical protein ZHAS_00020690 [Anopheles sinensis]|uniref:Uncharacterized protein n=1 Tax=Anopheles sinensis TaxID=74873 RepID=A0A084WQF1_ANOSI|nr:hypothetical protein ZHAS_00020690 [Anopheles sinensis]
MRDALRLQPIGPMQLSFFSFTSSSAGRSVPVPGETGGERQREHKFDREDDMISIHFDSNIKNGATRQPPAVGTLGGQTKKKETKVHHDIRLHVVAVAGRLDQTLQKIIGPAGRMRTRYTANVAHKKLSRPPGERDRPGKTKPTTVTNWRDEVAFAGRRCISLSTPGWAGERAYTECHDRIVSQDRTLMGAERIVDCFAPECPAMEAVLDFPGSVSYGERRSFYPPEPSARRERSEQTT